MGATQIPDNAHQFGMPSAGDLTDFNINQGYSDTCAIRSQEIILRDFGIILPQEHLIAQAEVMGIYRPGCGTSPDHVGLLLEANGVSCSQYENANVFDLARELQLGKRIIIGVDSGELWNDGFGETFEDFIGQGGADHALIVAGIDTTDPKDIRVILTDPGTGHVAKDYPLDQFMDAWKDSNNFMVVTDAPAPINAAGMENFNYVTGYVDGLPGIDFNDWFNSNLDNFTPYSPVSFDMYVDIVSSHSELFNFWDDASVCVPYEDAQPLFDGAGYGASVETLASLGTEGFDNAAAVDSFDNEGIDTADISDNGDTPSFGYSNL